MRADELKRLERVSRREMDYCKRGAGKQHKILAEMAEITRQTIQLFEALYAEIHRKGQADD